MMEEAIFYDDDGKVKLRIYLDGGAAPNVSITKAVSGPIFIDTDGKAKVRIYVEGSDVVLASGDAQPSEVLEPKTFSNDSGAQTGTMPNKTGILVQPTTWVNTDSNTDVGVIVPEGYYPGGETSLRISEPNLTADKIAALQTIFDVDGTFTSDATATAADIATGKTAYVNGVKITGTA